MMSYYYRSGERVPVAVAQSARVVRVDDERADVSLDGWISKPLTPGYKLVYSRDVLDDPSLRMDFGLGAISRKILEREHELQREEREEVAPPPGRPAPASMPLRPDLAYFPVLMTEDEEGLLFSTGDVVAQFPPSISAADLEKLCHGKGCSLYRTLPFIPNGYVFRADTTVDPLTLANTLVEQHGAIFAHPIFLEDVPERAVAALRLEEGSQPWQALEALRGLLQERADLLEQQWHLHNTGQGGARPGVDVNAMPAWQITMGSPAITLCIIDSGVESRHEAFQGDGKLTEGYDLIGKDPNPEPTTSSHGTSCAAVAAAGPVSRRVLGMAPGCRVMPIRRTELGDHLSLSEAFIWAMEHGADIINCSWGIDGRRWVLPDVVRAALIHTTTHGRNGRGCVIFWAAGNGNEEITSDEWASSPYVIAVAASTDQGQRAPYSDYGPEISICAPSSGGRNGITTATNGGYTSQFGGTSSAAPLAAGVAALVLSLAPNLRWQEVRELLQRSARKIDPAGGKYDPSGHSIYYGYGQVDALAALKSIDALQEIQRATHTEALAQDIQQLGSYLTESQGGRTLISFISARRLALLTLLQQSSSFREALARVMRLMGDIGARLATDTAVLIPEEAWSSIETVALALRSLPADPAPAEPIVS